jgi:hypothetical protein
VAVAVGLRVEMITAREFARQTERKAEHRLKIMGKGSRGQCFIRGIALSVEETFDWFDG